jgi:thiamine pyrophosphate-dependent acetolactate synthase large subunit-like protein
MPSTPLQPPTWADTLIEALVSAGVTRVYGHPHAETDAFCQRLAQDGRILFFPVVHGESAAMMASAHSKWTKQPAVCLAANASELLMQLNGLYDAAFDRNPVIVISGTDISIQAAQLLADVATVRVSLQPDEIGIASLNQALTEVTRQQTVVHIALDWLQLERCSPSLPFWFESNAQPEVLLPNPQMILSAAKLLLQAQRPTILVGRGAADAQPELLELAAMLQAPILTTMPGRAIVPDTHPHMVGGMGASGHRSAIETLAQCDVLLMLGSSNRGAVFGFVGQFQVIQVDRNPLQLGRRPFDTVGLYGNVKETLQQLREALCTMGGGCHLQQFQGRQRFVQQQRQRFEQWQQSAAQVCERPTGIIQPSAISHHLQRVLTEQQQRAIVTVDVGITTLWVYRHLVGDHDFIWSSSFATMGFAVPAAIAIRDIEPSRPVIAMVGDGGIGITMAELATAAQRQLPVVVIVFNNSKLAAIKYEQEVMGWPEYEATLFNCNFADYAQACGVKGIRVSAPNQLAAALREAITCGCPCLVDVVCDPHEMPTPPKIHILQGVGYLLAMMREFRRYLGSHLINPKTA